MEEYDVKTIHFTLFNRLDSLHRRFSSFNYIKSILAMQNNLDRVNRLHADLKKCHLLPKLIKDLKDDEKAAIPRENGNEYFAIGSYLDAMEFYTGSLTLAKNSDKLALAYANRSACLYKLEKYQECLTDIERALAHNYPDHLRPKLIARREKALELLRPTEAIFEPVPEIPESHRNPLIQSASDSVKIEENDEYGRHVVATKTIEVNEVISVEKPYACALKREPFIHCHACLILCYNPIPCDRCTMACFCTEECKDTAFFHQYECPILMSLIKYGLQSKLIVLKTAILARDNLSQIASFKFDKNDFYRSDSYKEIHCLRKRDENSFFNTDLFFDALYGTVIFELLKTTNFFEDNHLENIFKEEIVLLLNTVILNGATISEYAYMMGSFDDNNYAGGVFSFFALFNHSCCNNVSRTYHGSTQVLRAMRTIKAGEQCFVSYGYHYGTVPKIIRQMKLNEDYAFKCKCKACEEDWKLMGNPAMFLKKNEIRRQNPGRIYYSPNELLLLEKRLSQTADLDFAKETLPKLISQLKRCEHTEPSTEVLILQQMITNCYNIFGNKKKL